jgi:V8-like Glu-specific endopeptidase
VAGLEPAAREIRTTAFEDLSDSLSRVASPGAYPWSAHLQLDLIGPNGARKVGTGWVIGDKTILTAGHCVHDSGWMREIHVSLGGSQSGLPQRLPATYWNTTTEWINGATALQREAGDMGVVRVAESLAPFTAPLRYACYDSARLRDIQARRLAVSVAGFPVDPWGSFLVDAGVLTGVSGDFLLYDVETFKGQSGAPLLFWDEDGQPTVIGIHHWNVALNRNRAVRLSEPAAALLLNWTA